MTGTKPTNDNALNLHIIVRSFRGAQLVLTAYERGAFSWTNAITGRDKALKLPQSTALRVADRAAREYGAKCATLAADGTLTQPKAARPEPDYEVCYLGIENPDYFQGFGVSFTKFAFCVVGIGATAAEAYDDALEMMAQGEDSIAEDMPQQPETRMSNREAPEGMYHYVGIRWNVTE